MYEHTDYKMSDYTVADVKEFIKRVSTKFNISKKELTLVWNDLIALSSDALTMDASIESVNVTKATPVEQQPLSLPKEKVSTCVAVKRDKTVCGKPATHEDRCSAHKKKVKNVVSSSIKGEDIPEYQEPTPAFVQKFVHAGCVSVKKDKSVCGKPATHGDRCSVHKKKVKVTSKEVDALSSLLENVTITPQETQPLSEPVPPCLEICEHTSCESAHPKGGREQPQDGSQGEHILNMSSSSHSSEVPLVKNKKEVVLTMHPTLGLKWDWTFDPSKPKDNYSGTRFVFYTKNTAVPTVIAKYQERIKKLSTKDIQICQDMGLAYEVTEIQDIVNEYPIDEEGVCEYERIKLQGLETTKDCTSSALVDEGGEKVKNLATNPRKFPKKKSANIVETLEEVLSK
jgi:hypothetical protein